MEVEAQSREMEEVTVNRQNWVDRDGWRGRQSYGSEKKDEGLMSWQHYGVLQISITSVQLFPTTLLLDYSFHGCLHSFRF